MFWTHVSHKHNFIGKQNGKASTQGCGNEKHRNNFTTSYTSLCVCLCVCVSVCVCLCVCVCEQSLCEWCHQSLHLSLYFRGHAGETADVPAEIYTVLIV